jgi:hypothetical protein
MDVRKRALIGLCAVLMLVGLAVSAEAFYVDDKNTLSVSAKAQTRVTFRLQDSSGYTYPDTKVGDLIQWRNLALIEVDHDLKQLTKSLDILYPLKKLKIRSKYHIVGRFMYDALYNVGSDAFKTVRDEDKENIDSFKQAYDLWEAYIDFSRGPTFVRIGRQILAWGETDIFRLLDGINPLDNSFGGPFEDLDDRRIPLWMLRGSYNVGSVGPIASLTIEGFWVPGTWDARMGPWAPKGTPYSIPLPEKEVYDRTLVNTPSKTLSNSRYGVRLQGMLGSNANVSLAYYRSYLDNPKSIIVLTEPVTGPLLDTSLVKINLNWKPVQVVGGSINYWESITNTVFRGEIAMFLDEPVWKHGINDRPLHPDSIIPLSAAALSALALLSPPDLRAQGLYGIPLDPKSGEYPYENILRWMIGFDKQIWVRPMNKTSMFFVSMQYFGQWITNYPDDGNMILTDVPLPDKFVPEVNSITGEPIPYFDEYPSAKEVETIFTGLINTMYMKGTLIPQLAAAYDTRGSWLILPSVQYIWEPFRFGLQYAAVFGNFVGPGVFRDRDQISFTFTYLLN